MDSIRSFKQKTENSGIKKRIYANKPSWQIIIDLLISQDKSMMYRITRKMIIFLNRMGIPEVKEILTGLSPFQGETEKEQQLGANWPKPKGKTFNTDYLFEKIFGIADHHLSDDKLTELITIWVRQENMSFLSHILERRHATLTEVKDAVKRYLSLFNADIIQSFDEIMGLRVSLIYRFLSENLTYINIAKRYITIKEIAKILERLVGPANGFGKLGGKSAGLSLARKIINDKQKENPLLENVNTPKSRFLTSDGLLEFMHYNALEEFVFTKYKDNDEIKQEHPFIEYIFKISSFPHETINAYLKILDDLEGRPIVVRSSSLLEDSFEGAFSGKYKSLFISNMGTKEERLNSLINAITEVFASTFGPDPIAYRAERGLLDFREEMGVLIQQVVGNRIGKYYLPSYAGVAFSRNEFRWSPRIKREDGVIRLVAGLGTRAVDRTIDDYPKLVAPGNPNIEVNTNVNDAIRYSQQFLDVINLETNMFETITFQELIDESGGDIPGIEKMVSLHRDGMLIDPIGMVNYKNEDPVITFKPLIHKTSFIKQMNEILSELEDAYQGPVDIEFASDGKTLFLLQCRPQSQSTEAGAVVIPADISMKKTIFSASRFVSSGVVDDVEYVVYVDPMEYQVLPTKESMQEVGRIVSNLNTILPKRKFILMGPGRWGSKGDIKLGVPIIYSDINNTSMLIEIAKPKYGYEPDLSFGSHFFQDLVEADIRYLALYPDESERNFNQVFFYNAKNQLTELIEGVEDYTKVVKVIAISHEFENSKLCVYMDGDKNKALGFVTNRG